MDGRRNNSLRELGADLTKSLTAGDQAGRLGQ